MCQGDSGGPVYANNRGYGLVQSGDLDIRVGDAPNGSHCFLTWYYVGLGAALSDLRVHLV